MRRRFAALAVVLLSGLVLAGCGSDDNGGTVATPEDSSSSAKKVKITAADVSFDPTEIPLTAGEDVQFVIANSGELEHNLTVKDLGIDEDVDGGKTAEAPAARALKAGSYQYHCEYHPDQMVGTITVT